MSATMFAKINLGNNTSGNNSIAFTRLSTMDGHGDITLYIYGGASPANASIDMVFASSAAEALTEFGAGRSFPLLMPNSGDMVHQFHANPCKIWLRGSATAAAGAGAEPAVVWGMMAY